MAESAWVVLVWRTIWSKVPVLPPEKKRVNCGPRPLMMGRREGWDSAASCGVGWYVLVSLLRMRVLLDAEHAMAPAR